MATTVDQPYTSELTGLTVVVKVPRAQMYRQFTSGGTEKDVARWLKEMGYRGPGLKKESLLPLCRGEMKEVWDALLGSCRPAGVVKEMQRKVQLKLQRQAALESRQKTQEDAEKRQRQIERIQQLQQQCKERDAEVERLKSEVQEHKNDLGKLEGRYSTQKEKMQRSVERSKIVTAFVARTEDVTGSVVKEMQCVQKRNAAGKKVLQEGNEIGWADFESVMRAMHDFMEDHLSAKLRTRVQGHILKAEEALPTIEARPEVKDPAISRLMSGIGQLYSHHTKRLTDYFVEACRRAQVGMTHYEAKYHTTGLKPDAEWDAPQMAAIEEMQLAYLRAFLALKNAEERNRQRMASLKSSVDVQRLLSAVEESRLHEMFNCKLDSQCLQSEVEMLEKEIEKLETQVTNEGSTEKEVKEMYKNLRGHLEQSHQMDVLIQFCLHQIRQLKKDFDKVTAGVSAKIQQELPQSIETCIESLNGCEDALKQELESFSKFSLDGRMKQLSLEGSQSPIPSNFPLLQRTEMATQSEPNTYWTASLNEMETELKQMVPSFKSECPDALFSHIVQALISSLSNRAVLGSLRVHEAEIESESQHLCTRARDLVQKDKERERASEDVSSTVDALLSRSHDTLYRLQTDVTQAFEAFQEQPAFSSVPWLKRDGKHASEWVAHQRLKQNPSSLT